VGKAEEKDVPQIWLLARGGGAGGSCHVAQQNRNPKNLRLRQVRAQLFDSQT